MIGVLVFAISGALAASDKKMYQDLFGVFFTGFITAIGGGTRVRRHAPILAVILAVALTLFGPTMVSNDSGSAAQPLKGRQSPNNHGAPHNR